MKRKRESERKAEDTHAATHKYTHWHSTPAQKHTNTNIEDIAHPTLNCKREFVDCIVSPENTYTR